MDSENNHSINVTILDKEYRVACPPDSRQALLEAAEFLDKRMSEIRNSGKVFGVERIAVMAALNITNDFLSSQGSEGNFGQQLKLLNQYLDQTLQESVELEL